MRRREPLPRRGGSGSRFVRRQSRRALNPGWRRAQRAESREAGLRPAFSRRARRRCGVRRRGLGPWFYRLDRSRFPAGGIGSWFACRQSRRASKPGKRRAQRAECQEAGLRPASSRRARRRCGVRKKGLGSWFYRLDGSRSLQRGKRLPFCVSAKSARFKTRPAARTTRRISGRGLASPPPRRQRLPFLPHSALRSTSSPSGPCAICWKPAFSYRRTGPA